MLLGLKDPLQMNVMHEILESMLLRTEGPFEINRTHLLSVMSLL